MKNVLKSTKGITLIALVITIIVLLILAGVSIAMLTGENGILTQAQRAKNETENAARQEEMDLAQLEATVMGKDVPIIQVDDENPGQLEQENETTFVINSIEDLVFFSYDVTNGTTYEGKTVKLATNLDFNSDKSYVDPNRTDFDKYGYEGKLKESLTTEEGFRPIGSQDGTNSFHGTFDGADKAICSLYINIDSDKGGNIGLFTTAYEEIKNLGLVNLSITAIIGNSWTPVGGLVATGCNDIYNCYVTGNINVTGSSWMPVGGLCGVMQEEADIKNCYNLANIVNKNIKEEEGDADISSGGLVGYGDVSIYNCFNRGNIFSDGGNNMISIGGICGHSDTDVVIKNCYNAGKIEGIKKTTEYDMYIAGIVGHSNCSILENCYNLGEINGDGEQLNIAGVIARKYSNGTIDNVFNIGNIIIQSKNIRAAGGIIGQMEGTSNHVYINDAYNIGKIEVEEQKSDVTGSIAGTNWSDVMTYNNCYYLEGTYDVGVGYGSSTGVTKLDSIKKFPSVLDVVNGEGAFKEDVNNINGGYPLLYWE